MLRGYLGAARELMRGVGGRERNGERMREGWRGRRRSGGGGRGVRGYIGWSRGRRANNNIKYYKGFE